MTDEVTAEQEPIQYEDCGRALRKPQARAEQIGPKCKRKRDLALGKAAV